MFNKINLAINKVYKHFESKTEAEYLIMMSKQIFNLIDCMYIESLVDVPSICSMMINPYKIDPIEKKLDVERRFYNKLFRELQNTVSTSTDIVPTMEERKEFIKIRKYQFYIYMRIQLGNVGHCTGKQYAALKVIYNKAKLWARVGESFTTEPL